MKEKGFTLIELLAVIIVLGLLALIAVPNVMTSLKNNEEQLYKAQLNLIIDGAKGYIIEHVFALKFDGTDDPITLKKLQDGNYLDRNIQNPKTKTNFCDTMEINIVPVTGTESYTVEIDTNTIKSEPDC